MEGPILFIVAAFIIALAFSLFLKLKATITGRPIQTGRRTGVSTTFYPFEIKKQKQEKDEQDKIVIELNMFCLEVPLANYSKPDPYVIHMWADEYYTAMSKSAMWVYDDTMRPILSDRAKKIVNKGKVAMALRGYRNLKEQKARRQINNELYMEKLLSLYNACLLRKANAREELPLLADQHLN